MCHIAKNEPSAFNGLDTPCFEGTIFSVPKDGWLHNVGQIDLRVHCRHRASGEQDIHVVKAGEVLVCESEAVLTILKPE